MDKQGYLRIVEASIAIVLIMGVLFLFFTQQKVTQDPDFAELARDVLDELAKDVDLRNAVLAEDENAVEVFAEQRIPPFFEIKAKICVVDSACGIEYVPGNVYSAERSISSTLDSLELAPKKVRLFIWEAGN